MCAADGWSIAGLAAAVLGIAATVLSFIGAAAIAYWWIKLDERVGEQVTSLYEKQKGEVNTRVEELLSEQKSFVEKQLLLQQENLEEQQRLIDKSNRGLRNIYDQIDSIIDLTFSLADVNPPWLLENWAIGVTDKFKTAVAAKGMVLSYLKFVAGLLSEDQKYRLTFLTQLQALHAPSVNPKFYWDKAQEWASRIEKYYKPDDNISYEGEAKFSPDGQTVTVVVSEPLRVVREKMNEYRPKVDAYLATHPELTNPKEQHEV